MKKHLIQSTVALALMGMAAGASADQITDVNLLDGSGNNVIPLVSPGPPPATIQPVRTFDLSESGSGLALGAGTGVGGNPIDSTADIGREIHFLFQAYANGLLNSLGQTIVGLSPSLNPFEYTVVADMHERVVGYTDVGLPTATFVALPGSGTLSIFYDTAHDSNVTTGAGFKNGVEIARFTVNGGASNFSATSGTSGTGGTLYDGYVQAALDFVNPNYIQGILGNVIHAHFTSSQTLPAGTSLTSQLFGGPTGTSGIYPTTQVTTADLLTKIDASLTFFTVPEPGTLPLTVLGGALAMAMAAGSRRKHRS